MSFLISCVCVCVIFQQFFNDINDYGNGDSALVTDYPEPKEMYGETSNQHFIECYFNRRIVIKKAMLSKHNMNDICINDSIDVSNKLAINCNGYVKCGLFNLTKMAEEINFCPSVSKKLNIVWHCLGLIFPL